MKRVIATLLLLSAPAQAQVSSTAAPVANSSGSVTNQAVQVVPSRTPIPDGQPDNPGNVLYYRPIRTGQKTNYSINGGITATISVPLDRSHVRSCRKAAEKQVALLDAQLADKRLNYEIARLKNCASLMKEGISFHPDSPYASICADVVLQNPPDVIPPHIHKITYEESAETSPAQQQTQDEASSQSSP